MRNAFFAMFAAFCLSATAASPVSLESLIGAEHAKALETEASVKSMQVRATTLALSPKSDAGVRLQGEIDRFDPNVIVEALYVYPKPAESAGRAWSEEERTSLFNLLRSLSTLSGIEYYSASRERMRIFYENSYVVEGPDGTEALPDPVVSVVPDRSTLFAVQKDLSFGENRYRYDYTTSSSDIAFTQLNLTTMTYGFIPVVGKQKLKTLVLVSDTEEGYLLYAVSAAKTAMLPGLETKVKNSFSNRADAIYRWFSSRLDAAAGEATVAK